MKAVVTGAGGFIGSAVVSGMREAGMNAVGLRRPELDLASDFDVRGVMQSAKAVVHTAARVHVMHDSATDPLAEFRRVNVRGTRRLAEQAASAGVERFIFLSSIKVNGESTSKGKYFTPFDIPSPKDPYGVSKAEAETALREVSSATGMAVTIIRPVLVYGPGVKGNFLAMMRLLMRRVPLPLGAVRNARSLVSLDNLVDLILAVLQYRGADSHTVLVSDGEDLSTPQLLRRTAAALGTNARLVGVPPALIQGGLTMVGKSDVAQRILSSLQVDISATRSMLGWTPRHSIDEGLRRTAARFLNDLDANK